MNKFIILGGVALAFIVTIYLVSGTPSPKKTVAPLSTTPTTQTTPSQIPSIQTASQDPQDVVPGLYPNPIKNTATAPGFKITSLVVENNTDAAGNPVNDHLQLTLQNLTSKDLTSFEVYYTLTDTVTNKKEGYYKKLSDFVLPAGKTQTIHFDNKSGADHFTVNTHSLYFTSSNKLQFTVIVSTPDYAIQTAQVTKAAGGAETKD
ncbi:MAG: hypothetical protein M1120_00040 [Patescibacteria group bacterium]|nr:hypothetical protein [Patescibacteria group bacterium]